MNQGGLRLVAHGFEKRAPRGRGALVWNVYRSFTLGQSVPTSALNHCVQLVMQQDRERYLCNLHAPKAARPGLFAIHAFNIETAHVRNITTQEAAAMGRFGWWRSTLERAFDGKPPNHPVAEALSHAIARYSLTSRYLTQVLEARELDVRVQQPRTLDELRQYCERTSGSLALLGLECAGLQPGCHLAEHAAAQAGIALGIATLLRSTVIHASQGCTYLPAEVTRRHNVKLSSMLQGEASPELCDAVAEVADEAVAHLLAARSYCNDVPDDARRILLSSVVAHHILQNMRRHGFSPFASGFGDPQSGLALQFSLLSKRWIGMY